MENDKKTTVEQILGGQIMEIMRQENIYDLTIGPDGKLSGYRQTVRGLPVTDRLHNIQINILRSKITLSYEISDSDVDVGKII